MAAASSIHPSFHASSPLIRPLCWLLLEQPRTLASLNDVASFARPAGDKPEYHLAVAAAAAAAAKLKRFF
jgi:hypothetical protein